MPLGMEAGLGTDHTVLDGDPAALKRGTTPTNFQLCLLWPYGWIDQDATWLQGRPRLRRHCVSWGPSSPTERGTTATTFRPRLFWPNGRPSQQLLSSC